MISKFLEDRIHSLIEKAIATSDPVELEKTLSELRSSLKEHMEQAKGLLIASMATPPSAKKKDS